MNDTNPTDKPAVDITRIFEDHTEIHEAIREGGQRAIRDCIKWPVCRWWSGAMVESSGSIHSLSKQLMPRHKLLDSFSRVKYH